MNLKARIMELVSQVGTLFVVSVFISYYWKLIADHTAVIDWKGAVLITVGMGVLWSITRLVKHNLS